MNIDEQVLPPKLSPITIDRDDTSRALIRTTRALSELVGRHRSDDRRIPHLTWSVSQCLAHQAISDWMYAYQLVGPGLQMRIEDTSTFSDWSVSEAAGLDPAELGSLLERSTTYLIDTALARPDEAVFTWWSGSEAAVDVAIGLLLGERLVHGWDIAQAYGEPWPIAADDAAIAMAASFAVMPLIVDPMAAQGLTATIEMRMRGAGRYALRFDDGTLSTTEGATEQADARVLADPVSLMLVGYGRVSQWRELFRGKIIGWGRRPWTALKLGTVLRNP
jgi:uncharacterized protein (TIGR03083 family)